MDTAYADLVVSLEKLGGCHITVYPDAVVMHAQEGGYDISIHVEGDRHKVCFGDLWHEHFDDRSIAIQFFLIGLTTGYRLVESVRKVSPVRATLQVADKDDWRNLSQTGLFTSLCPWPRVRTVIRQNDLANIDDVKAELGYN
jgi:hypothetical protein